MAASRHRIGWRGRWAGTTTDTSTDRAEAPTGTADPTRNPDADPADTPTPTIEADSPAYSGEPPREPEERWSRQNTPTLVGSRAPPRSLQVVPVFPVVVAVLVSVGLLVRSGDGWEVGPYAGVGIPLVTVIVPLVATVAMWGIDGLLLLDSPWWLLPLVGTLHRTAVVGGAALKKRARRYGLAASAIAGTAFVARLLVWVFAGISVGRFVLLVTLYIFVGLSIGYLTATRPSPHPTYQDQHPHWKE